MNRLSDAAAFLATVAVVAVMGGLSCVLSGRTHTGVLVVASSLVAGIFGYAAIRRFERMR